MQRYFLYSSGVRINPIGVDEFPLSSIEENISKKLTESIREQEYQACGGCRGSGKAENNYYGSRRNVKSAKKKKKKKT